MKLAFSEYTYFYIKENGANGQLARKDLWLSVALQRAPTRDSWFSRDVTKILKSKPGVLQNVYLLLRKDYLKLEIHDSQNLAKLGLGGQLIFILMICEVVTQ